MKITEKDFNVQTGEETITEREMNAAEFKQYETDQAAEVLRKAEAETAATQKAALLARLGITADEAKLLIG